MINPGNKYTQMQKRQYAAEATGWTPDARDPVVGSFDAHNRHEDYLLLFDGIDTSQMVCLDFGCGSGRNIVRFRGRFKRMDGVDLEPTLLEKAKQWAVLNGVSDAVFYPCNGVDISEVPSDSYDFVMSTICLQHICVHEIRFNYFREFFRVLRPGGWIAIQMGFGTEAAASVGYYDNFYDAVATNRGCDTRIEDADYLKKDLESVGFRGFRYHLRPPGPGDCHPNWIYFQAQKPDGISQPPASQPPFHLSLTHP